MHVIKGWHSGKRSIWVCSCQRRFGWRERTPGSSTLAWGVSDIAHQAPDRRASSSNVGREFPKLLWRINAAYPDTQVPPRLSAPKRANETSKDSFQHSRPS